MTERSKKQSVWWKILKALASLKITVVLLVFSIVLVFFGTLAQINDGMWEMMEYYFKSYLVWCKLDLISQGFQYDEGTVPRMVGFPLPGGYSLGWMLMINLLAAHTVRWQFNMKRMGIILIHVSVVMLLVGMLITSVFQTEGNMHITEGGTASSYRDSHNVELVVTKAGDDKGAKESVVVLPQDRLKDYKYPVISMSETGLPFDLRVDAYHPNSDIVKLRVGQTKFQGMGKTLKIVPKDVTPGTKGGGGDLPSAAVSIAVNGKSLGSYLLSSHFSDMRQRVMVEGQAYYLSLRFVQYDLPYTLRLKDFRFDRHPGTNQPKNYQSDIVLIDPETGREDKTIMMNHPLDHRGLTFYQSSFDRGVERTTVLQVVGNPGSQLPYWACLIACIGLLWHFGVMLTNYQGNLFKREIKAGKIRESLGMRGQVFSMIVALVVAGWLISGAMRSQAPSEGSFDDVGFGRLPVQHGGRFKPISTLARDTLLNIQHKQRVSVFRFDVEDVKSWEGLYKGLKGESGSEILQYLVKGAAMRVDAITQEINTIRDEGAKLLTIIEGKNTSELARNDASSRRKWRSVEIMVLDQEKKTLQRFLFVILKGEALGDHQKVMLATGINILLHRTDFYNDLIFSGVKVSGKTKAYSKKISDLSLNELVQTNFEYLSAAYPDLLKKPKEKLISASQWILDINAKQGYGFYDAVIRLDSPAVIEKLGWVHKNQKYFSFAQLIGRHKRVESEMFRIRKAQQQQQKASSDDSHYLTLDNKLSSFLHAIFETTGSVGLASVDQDNMGGGAWIDYRAKGQEIIQIYGLIFDAYARGDAKGYSDALTKLTEKFSGGTIVKRAIDSKEYKRTQVEDHFTTYAPFYKAQMVYIFVFLMVIITWVWRNPALYRSALYLLFIAFVCQSYAMYTRMYLAGRPPVTDLYSSAIFIGWGVVLMSFYIEYLKPRRNAVVVAAFIAAVTLQVAKGIRFEANPSDTLKPLQAVLDTNFWLATHVTIVTIGYSAAFLAGILGISYIIKSCVFKRLTAADQKLAISTIYGVVCFSLICSLVGTVLGGIWADYSWGRFWGWDPKENGALMIVIWNAVILHARWAGLVKRRGIAVLSVLGAIVVAWSWFGTNMLGVGLHSYGFIGAAFIYLVLFWGVMLFFALVGVIFKDSSKAVVSDE